MSIEMAMSCRSNGHNASHVYSMGTLSCRSNGHNGMSMTWGTMPRLWMSVEWYNVMSMAWAQCHVDRKGTMSCLWPRTYSLQHDRVCRLGQAPTSRTAVEKKGGEPTPTNAKKKLVGHDRVQGLRVVPSCTDVGCSLDIVPRHPG
jgi:hypothetical protein